VSRRGAWAATGGGARGVAVMRVVPIGHNRPVVGRSRTGARCTGSLLAWLARLLGVASAFAGRNPAIVTWREDRFYRKVNRRLPALRIDCANGLSWYVRPGDDFIGPSVVRTGAFEPEKVAAVLALLDGNGISLERLIDVGANIGTTTIEVLRRRPGVSAVAFEPDPRNFQLLRLNLIANRFDRRVVAHRLALGQTDATLSFELSASNYGDHRVRLPGSGVPGGFDEQARETITVPGARLDDIAGLAVGPSTLVFIDVQGFEGHVLAGAHRTLAARPAVAFEFWPYGLDRVDGRRRLYSALAGYRRLFEINSTPPRPLALSELDDVAAALPPAGHTDLLALP
jgi:FkbM family methyltransferase